MTFSLKRSDELQLRLPAAFRHMIESYKHEIEHVDLPGTNSPARVAILFHWTTFVFLKVPACQTVIMMMGDDTYQDEADHAFGHVLCEFRARKRPWGVAEVPSRDLTTPGLIARPL
jgi:hypothetical protein